MGKLFGIPFARMPKDGSAKLPVDVCLGTSFTREDGVTFENLTGPGPVTVRMKFEGKPYATEIILRPCPFCGNSAIATDWRHGNQILWNVKCSSRPGECAIYSITIAFETLQDAADAWNQRA